MFSVFLHQLKLSQPNPDDLGYVDSISVEEIGGVRVCLRCCFSLVLVSGFFFSCFLASAVCMIFSSFPNKYI